MLNVALKEPLPAFLIRGLIERHHTGRARVEMFHEARDRAALPGRITAFEQQNMLLSGLLHPVLHLEQFHLKRCLLLLVLGPAKLGLVGVFAGLKAANMS